MHVSFLKFRVDEWYEEIKYSSNDLLLGGFGIF